MTSDDVENSPAHATIETLKGHVTKEKILTVSIQRVGQETPEHFQVMPNQCEWLIGYIAGALEKFNEDGTLKVQGGRAN